MMLPADEPLQEDRNEEVNKKFPPFKKRKKAVIRKKHAGMKWPLKSPIVEAIQSI